MMRSLVVGLLYLAIGPALWGQSMLADTLVGELCECIVDSRARPAEDRGARCLDRVGGKYEAATIDAYGLSVRFEEQRQTLIDTLSSRLAATCPELVPYVYNRRTWRFWSDSPAEVSYRYSSPKWNPGAAASGFATSPTSTQDDDGGSSRPPEWGVRELPTEKTFAGILNDLRPGGELYLEKRSGEIVTLFLPQSFRSAKKWVRRQAYIFRCTQTVSSDNRLVWKIVGVE